MIPVQQFEQSAHNYTIINALCFCYAINPKCCVLTYVMTCAFVVKCSQNHILPLMPIIGFAFNGLI